jgi:PPM family protein phosphatase
MLRRFRAARQAEQKRREMPPVAEQTPTRRVWAPSARACAITDRGHSRLRNEDNFLTSEDGLLWIVADGMGGQAAGDVASALTIASIAAAISGRGDDVVVEDPGACLIGAFHEAQAAVLRHAAHHEECRGMGAAALAAYLETDVLHVCHAGDVRCYVYGSQQLDRVTDDHTVAGCRNLLKQAVGIATNFAPSLSSRTLADGDRVLLCSDGLWDALDDAQIETILASDGTMRQLATILVDRAIHQGDDNVTAAIYEFTSPFPKRSTDTAR